MKSEAHKASCVHCRIFCASHRAEKTAVSFIISAQITDGSMPKRFCITSICLVEEVLRIHMLSQFEMWNCEKCGSESLPVRPGVSKLFIPAECIGCSYLW